MMMIASQVCQLYAIFKLNNMFKDHTTASGMKNKATMSSNINPIILDVTNFIKTAPCHP